MALLLALVVGTLGGGRHGAAPRPCHCQTGVVPRTGSQPWPEGCVKVGRGGGDLGTSLQTPPTPGTPAPHLTKEVGVSPWGVPPSAGSARELCFTGAETGPDPRSARGRRSRPPAGSGGAFSGPARAPRR